jgi:DNA-binding MarR family transcriptional regulator
MLESYRLLIADVYELAGASRRTSDDLARASGQTAARWHVLSVLSDGPRTVPSTARRLGLTSQSVQRVVDDLVRAGQLARQANPDHARSPLFVLTDAGRATVHELFARSDAVRGEMLERAGLTARQLDDARAVLRALLAAISGKQSPRDPV